MASPFLVTELFDPSSLFLAFCVSRPDSDFGDPETLFWDGATRDVVPPVSDPFLRTGAVTEFLRFSEAPASERFPDILWLG